MNFCCYSASIAFIILYMFFFFLIRPIIEILLQNACMCSLMFQRIHSGHTFATTCCFLYGTKVLLLVCSLTKSFLLLLIIFLCIYHLWKRTEVIVPGSSVRNPHLIRLQWCWPIIKPGTRKRYLHSKAIKKYLSCVTQ